MKTRTKFWIIILTIPLWLPVAIIWSWIDDVLDDLENS
jgi:hypothetical protein